MEGTPPSPDVRPGRAARAWPDLRLLSRAGSIALALAAAAQPSPALAQKVRITNLSDVDFGMIANLQAESRRSQDVCLYSSSAGGAYSVVASGSGPGGAFALANGSHLLAYDVEWSQQSGQGSGTRLAANVALSGQTSAATHQFCNSGPATIDSARMNSEKNSHGPNCKANRASGSVAAIRNNPPSRPPKNDAQTPSQIARPASPRLAIG